MDSLKSVPSFFGGLKVLEEPAESKLKFRDLLVRQEGVKYGLYDENEFHVVQNKNRATWIRSIYRRGSSAITDIARQLRTNYLFMSLDDKDIFALARQFEVVEYNVGEVIIEQGETVLGETSTDQDEGYYYLLVEGECSVFKNGKKLPGKYGILEEGSAFGEQAVLFDSPTRAVSIVASKGSSEGANAGSVILYRLAGKQFREKLGEDELKSLQDHMKDVIKVFDTLSGVDTKINKGTIIRPYKPSASWLISQYTGTVLQYVWPNVLLAMLVTTLFGILVEYFAGEGIGKGLSEEPTPGSFEWGLEGIVGLSSVLAPLATFVTTFFLNQSFHFWSRFYWTTRGIQGRLNDLSLILASYAARDDDGEIREDAKQALADISRLQRLLHQLFWSTVVKRFNTLHSPEGLSYLFSFSLITEDEYNSLVKVSAERFGVHNASMVFMTSRIVLARKKGEIELDTAATQTILDKITNMRMLMARILDMYDGRMPFPYVHFVNLLVHTFIFVSMFALFPLLYYWSIPAVGIIALFYKGILTLSLMFLDPVENDAHHGKFVESTSFDVGVLIREANAGSVRYSGCAAAMPKSY